jgi:hypothetical protein
MAALYVIGFLSSLGFSIVVPFFVFLVTRYGGNASCSARSARRSGRRSSWPVGSTAVGSDGASVLVRSQFEAMAA